jgi:hypothetical protein
MNHNDALKLSATERYLHGDLDGTLRDEFEAHFFDCADCANELRLGAAMLDQMKLELVKEPRTKVTPKAVKRSSPWPAWAGAIAASLLVVIGYQNLVQVPHLKTELAALNSPQLLPSVSLVDGVGRADELPSASVKPGSSVLLNVDIPTDDHYISYAVSVLDPAGHQVWAIPISAPQAKDTLSIKMPVKESQTGIYTLIIEGLTPGAKPIAVERQRFRLYSHN